MDNKVSEQEVTVEYFYSGFNLSFLTEEEKQTIYAATELYAMGKIRQQSEIIGRLTKENEDLKDTEMKKVEWLIEAKRDAGYDNNTSFDEVWENALSQGQAAGELMKALKQAVEVIKAWHNADEVWDIYYNNAPEMKFIKQTIANESSNQKAS